MNIDVLKLNCHSYLSFYGKRKDYTRLFSRCASVFRFVEILWVCQFFETKEPQEKVGYDCGITLISVKLLRFETVLVLSSYAASEESKLKDHKVADCRARRHDQPEFSVLVLKMFSAARWQRNFIKFEKRSACGRRRSIYLS